MVTKVKYIKNEKLKGSTFTDQILVLDKCTVESCKFSSKQIVYAINSKLNQCQIHNLNTYESTLTNCSVYRATPLTDDFNPDTNIPVKLPPFIYDQYYSYTVATLNTMAVGTTFRSSALKPGKKCVLVDCDIIDCTLCDNWSGVTMVNCYLGGVLVGGIGSPNMIDCVINNEISPKGFFNATTKS